MSQIVRNCAKIYSKIETKLNINNLIGCILSFVDGAITSNTNLQITTQQYN
jgi:hypothetical protein